MQCINCGKKLEENTVICPTCGKNQPDAVPAKKKGKKSLFASISLLFLVVGLCIIPLLLLLIIVLSAVGIIAEASIIDVIIQITKFSLIIAGPPLLLSLLFYILGK